MSIIAVKGVPAHWSLNFSKHIIGKTKIKSGFEILNFDQTRGNIKTAYIRVSEKWDPLDMVQKINRLNVKGAKLNAFIPSHVPDLPLAPKARNKQVRPTGQTHEWKLIQVHKELLDELLCKYMRLEWLSKKTGDKLLDEIAETLFRRLKHVMQSNAESTEDCFTLSKAYRKAHPHFADFQLLLSTLHRLEDAAGAPRTQVAEADLVAIDVQKYAPDNLPHKIANRICAKYEARISKKVTAYVESLPSEAASQLPEDAARARVRTELKNIAPYLNLIIKEVVAASFVPDVKTRHRMRIYGEPFLPAKEALSAALRRCRAAQLLRSQRLYNMLRYNVPLDQFAEAMAMDRTVIGGAKILVRPSPKIKYKIKSELIKQMNSAFDMDTD